MKYVVICKAGEQECANIFPTREEAHQHIVNCADIAGNSFKNLSSTSDGHFTMRVGKNETIEIDIVEAPDDEAYYEVEYFKNEELMMTKEFADRKNADDFAHDIINETGVQMMVESPMNAHFSGEWIIDKDLINLHIRITVHTVLNGQQYPATDMEFILGQLDYNRRNGELGGMRAESLLGSHTQHGFRFESGFKMATGGFIVLLFFGGLLISQFNNVWRGRVLVFNIIFTILSLAGLSLMVAGICRLVSSSKKMKKTKSEQKQEQK